MAQPALELALSRCHIHPWRAALWLAHGLLGVLGLHGHQTAAQAHAHAHAHALLPHTAIRDVQVPAHRLNLQQRSMPTLLGVLGELGVQHVDLVLAHVHAL